ncbi:MAG: AAA-like domain-containing protein, partial [Prochloraceae cyanobacterium]
MSTFSNLVYEYQVGGSLSVKAKSYVKRQADTELYNVLKTGHFCYVLNCRQMGKSSLLVRTMKRLLAEGMSCVLIDITSIGKDVSQEQWYTGVIERLWRDLKLSQKVEFKLETWLKEHTYLSPPNRLSVFIEEILLVNITSTKIIFFVDEIDSVLSLKFSIDDFFALIRAFYNKRADNPEYERIVFAIFGVTTPADLIQDKTRTPFNIGQDIALNGFQIGEVEPLTKNFQGQVSNPQALLGEILAWTGGQPFLTQKLCQLMVEELKTKDSPSVEQVVKSRIIEDWASQDQPEHLKTIKDRLLSNEERADHLLEMYQEILENGAIAADDSYEQTILRLSGLVVRKQGRLSVYNRIYQEIFNQSWVEKELANLRPYARAMRAWKASGYKDKSKLLRGKELKDALAYASGKNLSFEEKEFLAASKKEDWERKIRWGLVVLATIVLGGIAVVGWATFQRNRTQKESETISKLSSLGGELQKDGKSDLANEVWRQAGLSHELQSYRLKQALRLSNISLAYQQLEQWNEAERAIAESINLLRQKDITSSEGLQISVHAWNTRGSLLKTQGDTQNALAAYATAFKFLQSANIKDIIFDTHIQIVSPDILESVHRGLIELLNSSQESGEKNLNLPRPNQVKNSLKKLLLYELEYLVKVNKWEEANGKTYELILFIAERENEGWLTSESIKSLSCSELRTIDQSWSNYSNGKFGFRVQRLSLIH